LDSSRADNYSSWLVVGRCIYSSLPTEEGFKVLNSWSEKSSKYRGVWDCRYQWNRFRPGSYSIGTLKYYAKKDNPVLFKNIESAPLDDFAFI